MKSLLFFLALLSLSLATAPRLLQFLRVLSSQCSYHGYLYKSQCFCKPEWQGASCELTRTIGFSDDISTTCDNLLARLDHLTNISPENYPGDDYEFSRFDEKRIGAVQEAKKVTSWIKMHDITTSWQIFGGKFSATDIKQGYLKNSYFLTALASMAVHRDGQYIKDVFVTQTDNRNHVYVTRWMVAGKPRFVTVDDYVPGADNKPVFSKENADNDYWTMILEKSWAKIHGNYMNTEGFRGNDLKYVWKSFTQAPVFSETVYSRINSPALFLSRIKDKFSQSYPMGAISRQGISTLLSGHPYAIIGVYDLTLSSGVQLQLIKMYNPVNYEVWSSNPWAPLSSKWTPEIKNLVGYDANFQVFYLTPQDFFNNFDSIHWAEVRPDYETSFIDVPFDDDKSQSKTYTVNFTISDNAFEQYAFVYIDQPDARLLQNCQTPYKINSMGAQNSKGKIFNPAVDLIKNAEPLVAVRFDESYKFIVNVLNKASYSKYLTVTAYHPKGALTFTSNFKKVAEKNCSALRNCNGAGKCNYFTGTCECFKSFTGKDCSNVLRLCPKDCSGNGVCDTKSGICRCNKEFEGVDCGSRICPSNCLGKGVCDTKIGTCICHKGYAGKDCSAMTCPNNCLGNGVCDPKTGICSCRQFFEGVDCSPCKDNTSACMTFNSYYCKDTNKYFDYMKVNCRKFCGDAGYKIGFERCFNENGSANQWWNKPQ